MVDHLVSIIMPAYQVGAFIGEALHSIAVQTHTTWEVIVVDDHAPDDGTRAIVEAFARERTQQVRYLRHERNQGVSAARNTAIGVARGEFLAFLDPDDLWAPWHLERALARFSQDPTADVCTGPVINFRNGAPGSYRKKKPIARWKMEHFPHSLAVHNFIQPSATVVRRAAVVDVQGFETEQTLQHIEDYDLWIRLVLAGKRFAFLNEATSGYRKHASAASADPERMRVLDQRIRVRHEAFFTSGIEYMKGIPMEEPKWSQKRSFMDRILGRTPMDHYDWIPLTH